LKGSAESKHVRKINHVRKIGHVRKIDHVRKFGHVPKIGHFTFDLEIFSQGCLAPVFDVGDHDSAPVAETRLTKSWERADCETPSGQVSGSSPVKIIYEMCLKGLSTIHGTSVKARQNTVTIATGRTVSVHRTTIRLEFHNQPFPTIWSNGFLPLAPNRDHQNRRAAPGTLPRCFDLEIFSQRLVFYQSQNQSQTW
jgi:hypothetical protein